MANHIIPENVDFSEDLRKLETTDPGHADIFNPLYERLIKNDAYLKNELDTSQQDRMYQVAGGTETAITIATATLTNGYAKTFIASANNSGAATTINAKPLYKPNTTTAPTLITGKAYTVWYNLAGNCFFIKASAEGTATEAQVLAGVPYSNEIDNDLIGTMPDLSAETIAGSEWSPTGWVQRPGQDIMDLNFISTVATGRVTPSTTYRVGIINLVAKYIAAGVTVGGSGNASILGTFTADATAVAGYILAGLYAYINGLKTLGTMPDFRNITKLIAGHGAAMSLYVDPGDARMGIIDLPNDQGGPGYIDSTTRIKAQLWGLIPENIKYGSVVGQYPEYGPGFMEGTFTGDASLHPNYLLAGESGYDKGQKVIGTMPSRGSEVYPGWRQAEVGLPSSDGRVRLRIPLGAYLVGAAEQGGLLGVFCDDPNFIAAYIVAGISMFGLVGTATIETLGGKKWASGSGTQSGAANDRATISGLNFIPNIVIFTSRINNITVVIVYFRNGFGIMYDYGTGTFVPIMEISASLYSSTSNTGTVRSEWSFGTMTNDGFASNLSTTDVSGVFNYSWTSFE